MKILHCCLANFYIDGYSYQENILPKYHQRAGHTVEILASTETYLERTKLGYVEPTSYLNPDGIRITRIPYSSFLPAVLARKIRVYEGVEKFLYSYAPDLIFVHGPQFLGAREIVHYVESRPLVRLIVDSHADFINSGKTWMSKNVLHKILYRYSAKLLERKAEVFYGVLPSRVKFLTEVYGIAPEKVRLLVLGADVSADQLGMRERIRDEVRQKIGIEKDQFILISGGRIEERKQLETLVEATQSMSEKGVSLIIFGTPVAEMEATYFEWKNLDNVYLLGWIESAQVYDLLFAADLAVFPGTHSVLWEQSIGVGLPCLFRRWPGVQHVDLSGNCRFLDSGSKEEIVEQVTDLLQHPTDYQNMVNVARTKGVQNFSYEQIAKDAIS